MSTATLDSATLEVDAMPRAAAPRAKKKIPVRAMGFPFRETTRRFWLYGNPFATHLSNGINLLFPDGERFFIRSVKHYLDQIDDPELSARVKGFFGQEGRHGHEHDRFNKILEAQGYDIQTFLGWYREVAFGRLEKTAPPALRLSATAALEHFTAAMARNGLTTSMLDNADPVVADLLRWHAAEEIEHKSVAYDVFMAVDGRYSVRVVGLVMALGTLLYFWRVAAKDLLAQEKARGTDMRGYAAAAKVSPVFAAEAERRRKMFREAFLEYLRPDFHPDQIDDSRLADGLLASVGRRHG